MFSVCRNHTFLMHDGFVTKVRLQVLLVFSVVCVAGSYVFCISLFVLLVIVFVVIHRIAPLVSSGFSFLSAKASVHEHAIAHQSQYL